MALAITFLGDDQFAIGNVPARLAQVTPDTSYPTGGYAINGGQFGMASTGGLLPANNGIRGIESVGQNTASTLYYSLYDAQAGKFIVMNAGGTQVTAGTDIHTLVFTVGAHQSSSTPNGSRKGFR